MLIGIAPDHDPNVDQVYIEVAVEPERRPLKTRELAEVFKPVMPDGYHAVSILTDHAERNPELYGLPTPLPMFRGSV